MKKILTAVLVFSLLTAGAALAAPATSTQTLTINFTPAARAKLTLSAASITFPDSDPDLSPTVTAGPITVTSAVRTGTASTPTLTVLCTDLISGTNTIPSGNVSWTATGAGYMAGTMNKTTAQNAGSWSGSGNNVGTFTYALVNSWSYVTGTYAATATYTLSAP